MADRFWRGGTANWDGTVGTKWSATVGGAGGASVPTSADDVFFDATSGGVICSIAAGNTGAKSITCTGFIGGLTGSANITVSGSVTLVAGMTITYSGTLTINGTGTLTTAGKTLGSITINGSGITVTLGDAINVTRAGATLTITQGTFSTANFSVSAVNVNSNNSNTRTINMGSSNWAVSGSWTFTTITNLTLNAGTSTIGMNGSSAKSFIGGGGTYYNLNQGGPGQLQISGSNTFNNITNNTFQDYTIVFAAGTTQTVSNFGLSASSGFLVTIKSDTPGSQFTLSKASGTINADFLSIQDSNATGGATWNALASCVNAGNNSGWIFPSSASANNMLLMFI